MTRIEYVPPPETLSVWRKFLRVFPGFCRYCGRRMVPITCGGERVSLLSPLGGSGRSCPYGHVAFIDVFLPAGVIIRENYDNVRTKGLDDNRDSL